MSEIIEYDAPSIGIRVTSPFPLFAIGTTNTVTTLRECESIYPCTKIIDYPAMPWFCFSNNPLAGRPLLYLIQAHERNEVTLCVKGEEMDDTYLEALRVMYL